MVPRPATTSSAAFCTIGPSPFSRWLGSSYVFGTFEDEVVRATPGVVNSSGLGGHMTRPPPDGSIFGQRLRVASAGGWGADELDRLPSRDPQSVIVVIWDFDASCAPTAYGGPLPMGIPGEDALVVGRLRDPEQWVGGTPTIDTFWGGAMLYPITALVQGRENAEWAAQQWPPIPWEDEGELSAQEALELMETLPVPCQEIWDPPGFAARMIVTKLAYLDERRWPVPSVLEGFDERPRQPWRHAMCLRDPRAVPE